MNVGQERDFHGEPGETDLEQRVADREARYGPLVVGLRTGVIENRALLIEFAASLSIRTKSLRTQLTTAGEVAIDRIQEFVHTRTGKRRMNNKVLKMAAQNPNLQAALRRLPARKRKMVWNMIEKKVRSGDWENIADPFLQEVRETANVAERVIKAQRDALAQSAAPLPRVTALEELEWTTQAVEKDLILGDAVVVGISTSLGYHHGARAEKDLQSLFLPVSPRMLVVGRRTPGIHVPSVDELNEATASVSSEFFVAGQDDPCFEELRRGIGSKVFFGAAEMDAALRRI